MTTPATVSMNVFNITKAVLEDDTLLVLTLQAQPRDGRTTFPFPFEISNPTDAQKAALKKGMTIPLDMPSAAAA